MTCTHAALKRRDLVEAGFQYDNILMEESAQILEIETFIPLLLQVCWCQMHDEKWLEAYTECCNWTEFNWLV